MIRVYYMAEDEGGGGDEKKKYKDAPEGYSPLDSNARRKWNKFLDNLQSSGLAGSKDLDVTDKTVGLDALRKYNKENPDDAIDEKTLPYIQYEQKALRTGQSFPGVSDDQLKVLRQQFGDDFAKRQTADVGAPFNSVLSREYYPSFKKDGKDYGTDINAYVKDAFNVTPLPSGEIPKPDYNNPTSRLNYLKLWARKYGDLQGRGDTVLKVNEVPRGGSDTAKNLVTKAANEYGLDPALLYSSAMEEGMSGLFKDKSGLDTKHRKPGDFGYQDFYGDKEFPINGGQSFGFQTFAEKFPDLVKGGYLPKEFAKEFRGVKAALADDAEYADANNFKSVDAALKAKAAMMKFGEDYVEKEAKKHNIELSEKQKEFFTLAWFNGGEGAVLKRLPEYAEKGYLKSDDFINKRPKEEEGKPDNLDVWAHVTRRMRMASALKEQKLFDDQSQEVAKTNKKDDK